MLAHLAEVAATHTLDEWQVELFNRHATRDKVVHQHAVDRRGRTVVIIVFNGIGLDTIRQRLEMLTDRLSDLLLQIPVLATNLLLDNGRLVQIEQNVLVHHVLDTFVRLSSV